VARIDLAPLAGRALRTLTAENRHAGLLDAMLTGVQQTLETHRGQLRDRFAERAPRWLPNAVEDRIFDRLFDGVSTLLSDVSKDPDHQVRRQFDEWVEELADRLESSPDLRERAEQLKRDLLEHPELRRWTGSLWGELKSTLREQAGDPGSELRQRLAHAVVAAGTRLEDDPGLRAKAEELAEAGVRYVAEHFHDEIADLVSGTIARWDGEETSRKLELLLGRDLQFIRINGTVVGGLAGLVIHAVGDVL
jgi:uncharacterized membrane-anchored protein YjiN (DUF445 family)